MAEPYERRQAQAHFSSTCAGAFVCQGVVCGALSPLPRLSRLAGLGTGFHVRSGGCRAEWRLNEAGAREIGVVVCRSAGVAMPLCAAGRHRGEQPEGWHAADADHPRRRQEHGAVDRQPPRGRPPPTRRYAILQ
eukprot:scaffold2136_cov242-Pinguiococcus_pyrenoidosus.AAC.20